MSENEIRQVGLVGLGTMGRALAGALAREEFDVFAVEPLASDVKEVPSGVTLEGDISSMVAALLPPRRILLMVTAGEPVDGVLDQLGPILETGDVVIDGGNSNFIDTDRRSTAMEGEGIGYVGAGISGGEEGARNGASVMTGGSDEAFAVVSEILEAISAKSEGKVCCALLGSGGAGHFVKMVHNGIEYGLMQAIGEAYLLLKNGLKLAPNECASIFEHWNTGALNSFLVGITADILRKPDDQSGESLIELIDDAAAQTGTGRWMVSEAMALGVAVPTIAEAVAARSLSGDRDVRDAVRHNLSPKTDEREFSADNVRDALLSSFLACYAQGFAVLSAGSEKYDWPHSEKEIAAIWQHGCIIRSAILGTIEQAYDEQPDLPHLFASEGIVDPLNEAQQGTRETVTAAVQNGVPVPALSSALAYLDGFAADRLWTSLTQAQRDYFGAHRYRRTDRDGSFHSDWPGGGD
ncbi:MAG: phosphogluconate dehydrogenase (NADP(+)-dependent, decarboxylating) [Rhodospirillaceae bacterium]|nr:phosphogluconate dehydrogenase (NADP(+)-dependent, decarboxylating) [Rhodospirillaceae bacterium]|tara:strand:+ start:16789 stop:18186 length:1398 start_codon:yes stop_codon:yes gene_type:complete